MPQKLNKAGQMQDYIPKGNGDASGEYGTSNGTNKNFTTSDKKSSKANVITENKSVVVGDKEKHRDYTGGKTPSVKGKKETFNLKNGYTGDFFVVDELPNGWRVDENATTAPHGYVWVNNNESLFNGKRETAIMKRDNINSTKANVIDTDLTGKKYGSFYDKKSETSYNVDERIDALSKELNVDKKTIQNALNEGMGGSTRNIDEELRLYERGALESMFKLDKLAIHGDKANNMPIGKERTKYFNEEIRKVDKILDNLYDKQSNAKDNGTRNYYNKLFNEFKNRKNSLTIWKNAKQ